MNLLMTRNAASEVYMFEDETVMFFYDIGIGLFIDSNGYPVYNIFDYITPNMLFLFKKKKEYMLFETHPGIFVELIYPDDEEE